jgi:hypothetical protein
MLPEVIVSFIQKATVFLGRSCYGFNFIFVTLQSQNFLVNNTIQFIQQRHKCNLSTEHLFGKVIL